LSAQALNERLVVEQYALPTLTQLLRMSLQELKLQSGVGLVALHHDHLTGGSLTQVYLQVQQLLVLLLADFALMLHVLEDPAASAHEVLLLHPVDVAYLLQGVTFLVETLNRTFLADLVEPEDAVADPVGLQQADPPHLARGVAVGAAAGLSVDTFDLHHPDRGRGDGTPLVQVEAPL